MERGISVKKIAATAVLVTLLAAVTPVLAADELVLIAEAPDDESLLQVEDVAGRHLERFGSRNELSVTWVRAS